MSTSVVPVYAELNHRWNRSTPAARIGIDLISTIVSVEPCVVAPACPAGTGGEDFHAVCGCGQGQGGEDSGDIETHADDELDGAASRVICNM